MSQSQNPQSDRVFSEELLQRASLKDGQLAPEGTMVAIGDGKVIPASKYNEILRAIRVRVTGRHVLASYDPSVHSAADVHLAIRATGAAATELGSRENSLTIMPGWHVDLMDNRPAVRAP